MIRYFHKINRIVFAILISGMLFISPATREGFYCDVFEDAGTQIWGPALTPTCKNINFTMELLTNKNAATNREIMVKSADDANGYLLYPDGAPRYQIIFFHGGYMGHADDLGDTGKQRLRDFYYNGGSPCGSCAGSYMLAKSKWFNIWQGNMSGANVSNTPTDKIIPECSPLIGYQGIKAGDVIKGVDHNNGGSVDTTKPYPPGTQWGTVHWSGKLKGYVDIWIFKHSDTTGRVSGSTGHPEDKQGQQDQLKYMSAWFQYLSDGIGKPRIKSTLQNNAMITMDKKWEDNKPQSACIGDKQYHHFVLECKAATDVKIAVTGKEGFDFHIFVAKDTFAFAKKALYADTSAGANKTLSIPNLPMAKWHVGVKLNTTVTTTGGSGFPKYGGKLEVLNGISYTIKASWNGSDILASNVAIANPCNALVKNGALIIQTGSAKIKYVKIYNLKGALCYEPRIERNLTQYSWQPPAPGAYVIRIASDKEIMTRSVTVTR